MRKYLLTIVLLVSFFTVRTQNIHLGVLAGFSNYQGDLQHTKFTFSQAKPTFGVLAYYEISERFYARLQLVAGKVSGSDKISKSFVNRNLSFSSPVTEMHLGLEYDLLNIYERRYSIYIFGGIGAFKFNPYTIDSVGQNVYLQPLGTEGQGFYQGRKKYALTSMVIPFGGGLKFAVNDDVFVRLEAGIRKTFTDYLDDVSTTYADAQQLLANNGPKALELAFRGDELSRPLVYPSAGSVRGSPKRKDYYYIIGASICFRLSQKSDRNNYRKNQTGCPVMVY